MNRKYDSEKKKLIDKITEYITGINNPLNQIVRPGKANINFEHILLL